jgi:two-component system chemotaxis response regulator CheY
MRVMVIDDSRAMRTILGRMLRELGFETCDAADGKAALEALKASGPVGLALVDWNMPEMSGYELVQAIRNDRTFDSMRLMMVTTEADMENVAKALEAGADEYLMKPFTKEAVSDKLSMLGIGPA